MPQAEYHSLHLTIDIGNTRTKLVAFANGQPIDSIALTDTDVPNGRTASAIAAAAAALADRQNAQWEAIAWCHTGAVPEGFTRWAEAAASRVVQLTGLTPTSLQMLYRTPHTLGADRLAAALGAASLMPDTHLLVIDVGTCITYDVVEDGRAFLGGNISPGVQLRLQSLHHYTAALPLVEAAGEQPLVGYNTETAIRSGVIAGVRAEILGVIRNLSHHYPQLQVWLTGGEALGLDKLDDHPLQQDGYLVARGLESLLTNTASLLHNAYSR